MVLELTDIGILILFTLIGGIVSTKLKQPLVLGLILMGAIIGPNLLGLIHDIDMIDKIIELAAILSLFMIGMEFSLKKILKIGLSSILAALFKVGIMFFIVFMTIVVMGYDTTSAVFAGIALSFSSTIIITAILKQKGLIHRKEVPLLIAILILEDIFGIAALTFFSSARTGSNLALISGIQSLFIGLTVMVLLYFIMSKTAEKAVRWIHNNTGDETVVFIALALCIGFAYIANLLGLSPSAGAFFAGSVVANFKHSKLFEHSIRPLTFMLTSFFFISMGTLVDFSSVIKDALVIVVLCVIVVIGLFISLGVVGRMFAGFSRDSGRFMALAMLPGGTFSLLIAREADKLGTNLGLMGVVSVMIIIMSIFLNLALTHKDKLISKKPYFTFFEKIISTITLFLSKIISELEIESGHTKEIKRRGNKAASLVFLLMVTLLAFRWLIELVASKHSLNMGYVLFGIAIIITVYEIYKIGSELKRIYGLIIRMMADLEGGVKVRKIKKATQALLLAIISLLTGVFVPFFMHFVKFPFQLIIIISFSLVFLSLISFFRAYLSLSHLTFQYKYNIKEHRKIKTTLPTI